MATKFELVEIHQGARLCGWSLSPDQTYTVGRQSSGADIEVRHPSLSRRHCSLRLEGASAGRLFVTVTDLGSTNGTFVNGERLDKCGVSTARHDTQHGIAFGECKDLFRIVATHPAASKAGLGVAAAVAAAAADTDRDWAEENGKRGIAFDYGSQRDGRGGRARRSRSRRSGDDVRRRGDEARRQRAEEGRHDKRERRKALWSGSAPAKAHSAPTPAADSDGSAGEDPVADGRASAAVGGAGAAAGGSANGWERSSFRSTADKSKFLRLMGAKGALQDAGEEVAGSSGRQAPGGQHLRELEHQYWQGMRQSQAGRGRGLGAW